MPINQRIWVTNFEDIVTVIIIEKWKPRQAEADVFLQFKTANLVAYSHAYICILKEKCAATFQMFSGAPFRMWKKWSRWFIETLVEGLCNRLAVKEAEDDELSKEE